MFDQLYGMNEEKNGICSIPAQNNMEMSKMLGFLKYLKHVTGESEGN